MLIPPLVQKFGGRGGGLRLGRRIGGTTVTFDELSPPTPSTTLLPSDAAASECRRAPFLLPLRPFEYEPDEEEDSGGGAA
mgnify:CR=1 FL=1